ncbi:MAG: uridine kinase [Cyclobacteriaceae bacterium]|nr:uridine kinase [Cyclobacteriaceae bacterium]
MKNKTPYIVGITGASGAGKTYVVKKLIQYFNRDEIAIVYQDNYYRPRHTQPLDDAGYRNFDTLDSIDFFQLKKDLESLLTGQSIDLVEYTYNNSHANPGHIVVNPAPIILLEGIFTLSVPEIKKLVDYAVFVVAPEHLMLRRRIERDNVERGYDLEDVLYRFEQHMMPAYHTHVLPIKDVADHILYNSGDIDREIEKLANYLKSTYL